MRARRGGTFTSSSSINRTSPPATNRSRAARPKRSSGPACVRRIEWPSWGSRVPGPSWDSPPIGPAPSRSSRRFTQTCSATPKSCAGALGHEACRSPAATDKVVADVLVRQSTDLTADVGGGIRGDGGRRGSWSTPKQSDEPGVMRKIMVENARTVVAQAMPKHGIRSSAQRHQRASRSVSASRSCSFSRFHQHNVVGSSSRWPRPPPRATPSSRVRPEPAGGDRRARL